MELDELTHETKVTLHSYLLTFTSHDGARVLDDLRKSYFQPFDENRFHDHSYLVERATQFNLVKRIERCMERAAELIQTTHGVTPSSSPKVETGEDDI